MKQQLESITARIHHGMLDAGTLHSVVPAGDDRSDDEAAHRESAPGDGALRQSSEVPFVDARSEDEAAPPVDSVSSASASGCWTKDAGETWADAGVIVGSRLEYWTELGLLMRRQEEAEALAAAAAVLLEGPHLVRAALDLQRETAAEAAAAHGASARALKKERKASAARRDNPHPHPHPHPNPYPNPNPNQARAARRKAGVAHDAQQLHDAFLYAACEAMARHGFEAGHLSPPALEAWAASAQVSLSPNPGPDPDPDPDPNPDPDPDPDPDPGPDPDPNPDPSPNPISDP